VPLARIVSGGQTGVDRGALDAATAATLQNNLAVIDLAIGESRTALSTEPDNEPAQQSLLDNFVPELNNPVALVCGSKEMMEQTRTRLLDLGFAPEKVLTNY